MIDNALVADLRSAAYPLSGGPTDYDRLLDRIGAARFVLIGEASHGTHEFYRDRARITLDLIKKKGFDAVCVEADFPDAWRIDRFVRHASEDEEAIDALGDFERFPQWMWRNADVLDFVGELRDFAEHLPPERRIGFYGLDLYSLHASMNAVVRYLEGVDADAAQQARRDYACFDHFGADPQQYALGTARRAMEGCEDQVIAQMLELQRRRQEALDTGDVDELDAAFAADMNARVAKNAEAYYRAMLGGRVNTWNLRDTHMADVLDAVVGHLTHRNGRLPKIVVWAHNSHVGDARFGEMGRRGEVNLGQLVRERHGEETFIVGFTTWTGTVTAASDWGARAERKRVLRGRDDSWNALFHEVAIPRFWIDTGDPRIAYGLQGSRLERAIGVIYLPETERWSHYFGSQIGRRFDAVIHHDETRAVEPLERYAPRVEDEMPETWPSSM